MDVTCSLHARMRGARILVLRPPGFAVKNTLRGIGGNGSDLSVTPEGLGNMKQYCSDFKIIFCTGNQKEMQEYGRKIRSRRGAGIKNLKTENRRSQSCAGSRNRYLVSESFFSYS